MFSRLRILLTLMIIAISGTISDTVDAQTQSADQPRLNAPTRAHSFREATPPTIAIGGGGGDQAGEFEQDGWAFSIYGGYTHQFEANLSGGPGDVTVERYFAGLNANTQLNRDWGLSIRSAYEVDDFSFQQPNFFGTVSPWDDVQTFSVDMIFTYRFEPDWRLFGGPIIQFAGEDGADFGDGFTGGGIIGLHHEFTEDFSLGLGVSITSQLEDNTRVFPIIQLDWHISDDLRLSSGAREGGTRQAIELIWDVSDHWEVAGGLGYAFSRFALDDSNVLAPAGVGEEERYLLGARLTYQADNIQFDLFAGVVFDAGLSLDNFSGRRLGKTDYKDTEMLGGAIRFRF